MIDDVTQSTPNSGSGPQAAPRLSNTVALLLAVSSGEAVASAYYAQPLLDAMSAAFDIDQARIGLVGTATQIGYALGLLLIVPLGDLLSRRRLIAALQFFSAPALAGAALAPTGAILLGALVAVGALAVLAQISVAYAADHAGTLGRGKAIGIVTSGIIIGILLARAVSGALADMYGWRSIYALSSVAAVLTAIVLFYVLPDERRSKVRVSYPRLVLSLLTLYWELSILRSRAALAFLMFFAITTLVTPLSLVLSSEPFNFSHTAVGLFGLAGAAGALGANVAGRWSDDGRAEQMTLLGLGIMLAAWLPSALLSISLAGLIIGVLATDFGLQAAHVANQSLIYRVRPDARSRVAAAYMLLYSAGCAVGSIASTLAFAHGGWMLVCIAGSTASALAIVIWAATRNASRNLP